MNKLESFFFRRIVRQEVRQGGHSDRIKAMYSEILSAARDEFYEDNMPTLIFALRELFEESLREN
jgi:hypothetical protein